MYKFKKKITKIVFYQLYAVNIIDIIIITVYDFMYTTLIKN